MKRSFLVILGLAVMVTASLAFTKDDPLYKNLKILPKNITTEQMDSIMNHYCISLNVGCDFCHVDNKITEVMDYASDAKKHKLIARDMMRMTDRINDKYFDVTGGKRDLNSKLMVTCYTCHNGSPEPMVKPPVTESNQEKQAADSLKRN